MFFWPSLTVKYRRDEFSNKLMQVDNRHCENISACLFPLVDQLFDKLVLLWLLLADYVAQTLWLTQAKYDLFSAPLRSMCLPEAHPRGNREWRTQVRKHSRRGSNERSAYRSLKRPRDISSCRSPFMQQQVAETPPSLNP